MPDTMMQTESQMMFRNRSAETAKLAAALAAAQKNFAPIPKDREVTVTTQTGGSYKFKYATLDGICAAIFPALAEQSLAISQSLTSWGENYALETTLFHSSGEWLSNVTPMFLSGRRTKEGKELPPGNQELGGAQTYARRYGISALLCITADEDDDANHADGNTSERTPYKPGARGSAGGGSDFRPAGPRKFQGGPVRTEAALAEANRDGLTTAPPAAKAPATNGKKSAADKAKEWTDKAIQTISLPGQHVESLDTWWKAQDVVPEGAKFSPLAWLQEAAPAEYDRLLAAFEDVRGNAKQVAA